MFRPSTSSFKQDVKARDKRGHDNLSRATSLHPEQLLGIAVGVTIKRLRLWHPVARDGTLVTGRRLPPVRKEGATNMTRILQLLAVLAAALSLALPASAATLTRTFVSSSGSDSNACTITAPCASFARAYTQVVPSGIIAALDPGKYGPLTINMPITVNGNGWAAITGTANGAGITISTPGTGTVVILNGLEIDGAGAAYNGIEVTGGTALTVSNCTLQNFVTDGGMSLDTGNGILLAPTADTLTATIVNTTASNNGNAGIVYLPPSGSPSANVIIDHVIADANNSDGILVYLLNTSGGTTSVSISDTVASGNPPSGGGGAGININNPNAAALDVAIDNVTATNNTYGIAASGAAKVVLGRSLVTGNGTGVFNNTSPTTFYSYGDNRINLNGTDGYSSLTTGNTIYSTH
jgi:hypothetical protein